MMVMTDQQASVVRRIVHDFLSQHDYFNPLDPGQVDELILQVKQRLGDVELDEVELECVSLLCAVGPRISRVPPEDLRDRFLQVVRQQLPDPRLRRECLGEFAVAFGAGKWRTPGEGTWHDHWEEAVDRIGRLLHPALRDCLNWLSDNVVGQPHLDEDELLQVRRLLAWQLIKAEHHLVIEQHAVMTIASTAGETLIAAHDLAYMRCLRAGAKYVFTVLASTLLRLPRDYVRLERDTKVIVTASDNGATIVLPRPERRRAEHKLRVGDIATLIGPTSVAVWECTCGNRNCDKRHRLSAWDPIRRVPSRRAAGGETRLSLATWLTSSVKGCRRILAGSLVQNLLFQYLSRERISNFRLRFVSVEKKECASCKTTYEGERCPVDGRWFDPSRDRRVSARHIIATDTDPAHYLPVVRVKCKKKGCENLFELPKEWQGETPWERWQGVQEAKQLRRSRKRRAAMARARCIDKAELEARIAQRLDAIHCPICGSKASERPTFVWERQWFVRQQMRDDVIAPL
jgi:hypothetical protein